MAMAWFVFLVSLLRLCSLVTFKSVIVTMARISLHHEFVVVFEGLLVAVSYILMIGSRFS